MTTTTLTAEQWAQLRAPFEPAAVSFRTTATFERNGQKYGVVAAYIDARDVYDRLDEVVGPENWSFDWTPIVTSSKVLLAAKGMLTVCGITKCDVGDSEETGTEPTKTTVSDAVKRAAVLFGIARYLYNLPFMTAKLEQKGKSWVIVKADEDALRTKLPRPKSAKSAPAARTTAAAAAKVEQHETAHEDTSATTAPAESPAYAGEPHERREIQYPATETHERASSDAQAELSEVLRKAGYNSVSTVDAWLFTQLKRPVKAAKLKAGESGITLYEVGKALEALAAEKKVPA